MERAKRIAVAGAAALLVFGTGAIALASVPSSDGTIHACRSNPLGTIRVIDADAGQRCRSGETPLDWNQTGPPGPAGRDGENGTAGPAGAHGQKGDPGITDAYSTASTSAPPSVNGVTDVLALSLPAGAFVIQATASVSSGPRVTSGACFFEFEDLFVFGRTDFFYPGNQEVPVSVLGPLTSREPATVNFRCAWGTEEGAVHNATMIATKVGVINQN